MQVEVNMKIFFICCAIFLAFIWIVLAVEHGEDIGGSILDAFEDFFGEDDDE